MPGESGKLDARLAENVGEHLVPQIASSDRRERAFSRPASCAGLSFGEEGEIIVCDDCGSELEVIGKDNLQEAPQEEEDWGE